MIDIHDDSWMKRDLYGYGPDRPDAKWPNGAKIAVNCEFSPKETTNVQSSSTTRKVERGAWKTETSMPRPCCTSMDRLYVDDSIPHIDR
mgnify:CR=1 FL=1|jgi:hypothetical protein